MQKLLYWLFFSCLMFRQLDASIIETIKLDRFEEALEGLDSHSLVLFDVDETLIVPKDHILNYYAKEMCERSMKEAMENSEISALQKRDGKYLSGQIFAKMEYKIVDQKAVKIVRALQQKNIKTIAFTKMATGSLGNVASLENWRFEHLKKHQFDFSAAFPQFPQVEFKVAGGESVALFKQGVLYANKQDKGPVLKAFLEAISLKPSKIIFIDNRLDYLQSVEMALEGTGIPFIGFHYREVESHFCRVDPHLARFQFLHLVQSGGEWLSDEEAAAHLCKMHLKSGCKKKEGVACKDL